ncbi:hypothetical protein Bca4012_010626 [Brassica carinata]
MEIESSQTSLTQLQPQENFLGQRESAYTGILGEVIKARVTTLNIADVVHITLTRSTFGCKASGVKDQWNWRKRIETLHYETDNGTITYKAEELK